MPAVLSAEQMGRLLDSIKIDTIVRLRDRALIGVMAYSVATASVVIHMNMQDYYPQGERYYFRLHENRVNIALSHSRCSEILIVEYNT